MLKYSFERSGGGAVCVRTWQRVEEGFEHMSGKTCTCSGKWMARKKSSQLDILLVFSGWVVKFWMLKRVCWVCGEIRNHCMTCEVLSSLGVFGFEPDYLAGWEFDGRTAQFWIRLMSCDVLSLFDMLQGSEFISLIVKFYIYWIHCDVLSLFDELQSKFTGLEFIWLLICPVGLTYHTRPSNSTIRPGKEKVRLQGFKWLGLRSLSLTSLHSEPCKAIPTGRAMKQSPC